MIYLKVSQIKPHDHSVSIKYEPITRFNTNMLIDLFSGQGIRIDYDTGLTLNHRHPIKVK